MTDFSKTSLSLVENGPQYEALYDNTWVSSTSRSRPNWCFGALEIIAVITTCICIIGLLGNGIVICLLGFNIKRSPFTTYILNLAAADFGLLLFCTMIFIAFLTPVNSFLYHQIAVMGVTFMHNTSQLLLTAISIDRCVSVLCPIWHRCDQLPHLSTTVCALIWVISFLLFGSLVILYHLRHLRDQFFPYPLIAGAVLCLPLIMISTLILLLKVFCRPWQPWRGRLLTILLLTFFFRIFGFRLNAIYTVNYFISSGYYEIVSGFICISVNSSVSPVIYYIVGRKKRGQKRQSLKVILQRAFEEEEEEEEEHREEQGTTAQTSL